MLTYINLANQKVISFNGGKGEKVIALDLSKNQLETLERDTFKQYEDLEILYLQENNIQGLPSGIFNNLKKNYYLDISRNYIKELKKGTLAPLSKLNQLAIYRNCIDDQLLDETEDTFIQQFLLNWKDNQYVCIQ
ncbi:MAG: leucine-rich repeat domain-containing protein [Candidatus Peribacteria bacterium]|nr:leucine-rich repeat domain-containing protein [Candidatus Peribacteria bacterium]